MSALRIRAVAAAALLGTSLQGCALFSSEVEVSRRYRQVDQSTTIDCAAKPVPVDCYKATVSALPLEATDSGVAATSLSDRAQAAYVEALAERTDDLAGLKAALAAPAKPASQTGAYTDMATRKLRFVIGLFPTNGYLNPADRLTWASVRIEPFVTGGSARFVSWTQAANREEVIDVGSITASRTDKITANTGLKIGNPLVEPTVGGEFSATREEKADIKDRVSINANIDDGNAFIVQDGGWRRDLRGNATFDASVRVDPGSTKQEFFTVTTALTKKKPDGTSEHTAAPELNISRREVNRPKPRPLCARVTLDFVARRTGLGHRTFTESDDHVSFLRGSTSSIQNVAPPAVIELWKIVDRGVPLQLRGGDQDHILQFATKQEALAFLAWLRLAKPVAGKVGNGVLYMGKAPLKLEDHPGLDPSYLEADEDWRTASASCEVIATGSQEGAG